MQGNGATYLYFELVLALPIVVLHLLQLGHNTEVLHSTAVAVEPTISTSQWYSDLKLQQAWMFSLADSWKACMQQSDF